MSINISNRKIIIVGQGPSVKKLEENIQLFKNKNNIWAGLNRIKSIEQNVLLQINKRLDIVYCSSSQRCEQTGFDKWLDKYQLLMVSR